MHFFDSMRSFGGEVDLDTLQAITLEHHGTVGKPKLPSY